MIEAMNSLPVK